MLSCIILAGSLWVSGKDYRGLEFSALRGSIVRFERRWNPHDKPDSTTIHVRGERIVVVMPYEEVKTFLGECG